MCVCAFYQFIICQNLEETVQAFEKWGLRQQLQCTHIQVVLFSTRRSVLQFGFTVFYYNKSPEDSEWGCSFWHEHASWGCRVHPAHNRKVLLWWPSCQGGCPWMHVLLQWLCCAEDRPDGLSLGHGLVTPVQSSCTAGLIWFLFSIWESSASHTALLLQYCSWCWCLKSSYGSIVKTIIKYKSNHTV